MKIRILSESGEQGTARLGVDQIVLGFVLLALVATGFACNVLVLGESACHGFAWSVLGV